MTEEIIDGVDVSGCKYFQIEANTIYPKAHYCGSTFNRFCEDDENCVYKQLKKLEFENKLLKADYEASETENAKLKDTLEEIKKISKIAFAVCDDDCGNANKFMDIINKVSEVLKDE